MPKRHSSRINKSMNLSKYIGDQERIKVIFGISPIYYLFQLIGLIAIGSLLAWFVRWSDLFVVLIIVSFFFFIVYRTIIFTQTRYFSTENKLYRKTGFLFIKVISVEACDITDMVIKQGVLERFLFDKGKIKVNTPGTNTFEIVLTDVWRPFERKRQIQRFWDECNK